MSKLLRTTELDTYATGVGSSSVIDAAQRSTENAKVNRIAEKAVESGLAPTKAELSFSACTPENLDVLGIEPEVFFPYGREDAMGDLAIAQSVCATCPRAERCLAFGRAIQAEGVWGGQLLKNGRDFALNPVGRPPKAADQSPTEEVILV